MTLKAIDDISVKLRNTGPNQTGYPQPESRQPGRGYPLMAVCASSIRRTLVSRNSTFRMW